MESPLKDGLPSGKLTLCQPDTIAYSIFFNLKKARQKQKRKNQKANQQNPKNTKAK